MANNLSFDLLHKKHYKLDLRDKKMIHFLVKNARMSFSDIAREINLSKESVQYRFHRLIKKDIILKTYSSINYEKLGFQKYHLLILLDDAKKERVKQFLTLLNKDENVLRVIGFSDNWDLEVVILARNVRDFDAVIQRLLEPFDDLVLKKDTEAVIDVKDNNNFPEVRELKIMRDIVKEKKETTMNVDNYDLQILSHLSNDARISTYKLSQQIKLSPDTIGLRIKKLIQAGIIKGFTCLLNFSDLGYQGYVFCFSAANLSRKEERKFMYYAARNNHVISVKKMLGVWDIKNYVVVKKPLELHSLIQDIKIRFGSIVRRYQTLVIYKEHVFNIFPKVLLNVEKADFKIKKEQSISAGVRRIKAVLE